MREITASEFIKKVGARYAVAGHFDGEEDHIFATFGSYELAHDYSINLGGFMERCEDLPRGYKVIRVVPDHEGVPEPYTHSDVMQAVCAALLFGEDIGIAARDAMADAMRDNTKISVFVTLNPGAGNHVRMSPLAAHLLATADGELPRRGVGMPYTGGHTDYDMRAP